MKILHFGSVAKNKASGLSFSIPNLIKSQNSYKNKEVAFLFNTKIKKNISRTELKKYNIIVLHSYFIPLYLRVLMIVPRKTKIIICPRGAFSQQNKFVTKKHIYTFFYFSIIKLRKLNVSIHFLTEGERNRSRFRCNNDFILGNTIQIKNETEKINELGSKFYNGNIVYIGRFSSHIKGLDLLFELILENKELLEANNIRFDFYGPNSPDKELFMKLVNENNLSIIRFFEGVFNDEKNSVMRKAKFHILNSRSEGFPMSVLESSSFYTPQLLSGGTNLKETMINRNFGLAMDEDVFEKIISLSFIEYKEMALQAYNFALDHSLDNIGEKSLIYYFK